MMRVNKFTFLTFLCSLSSDPSTDDLEKNSDREKAPRQHLASPWLPGSGWMMSAPVPMTAVTTEIKAFWTDMASPWNFGGRCSLLHTIQANDLINYCPMVQMFDKHVFYSASRWFHGPSVTKVWKTLPEYTVYQTLRLLPTNIYSPYLYFHSSKTSGYFYTTPLGYNPPHVSVWNDFCDGM